MGTPKLSKFFGERTVACIQCALLGGGFAALQSTVGKAHFTPEALGFLYLVLFTTNAFLFKEAQSIINLVNLREDRFYTFRDSLAKGMSAAMAAYLVAGIMQK